MYLNTYVNAFITLHLPLHAERNCGLEVSDPSSQQVAQPDVEFNLTRCITIPTQVGVQRQLKPMDKWMHCMQFLPPGQIQSLKIDKKSDWKSVHEGHVLLYIDIPNQQVYPLPLLITPVHCIYLIAFDLPNGKEDEEKVLRRINDTMKDVYAYSSCKEPWLDDILHAHPNVFLIGLQKEERDRSAFGRELRHMLDTRSYGQLLVNDYANGNRPYWISSGADVNILENTTLLQQIFGYCCRPTQTICQLLVHHCELHQRFSQSPIVPYDKVEATMANLVSDFTVNPNFEQFLKVLHCFGFIFYRSIPKLAKSDSFVVLQPQFLCQLFAEVQQLSSDRASITIADLFNSTASSIQRNMQEWFQKLCLSMGLVIELPGGSWPNYVFVMGLNSDCKPPERAHFSTDPLLVSYRPQGTILRDNDCFLPSPLFPAFVSIFLKKLKMHIQNQYALRSPDVKNMAQHYIHVSIQGTRRLHIVERESFIEIGLQQFHYSAQSVTERMQLEKLRQFCKDICTVVSDSAECAIASLTLDKASICYGFYLYNSEDTEGGLSFGEYYKEDCVLQSCTDCPPQNATLQQRIWFQNIEHSLVCNVHCIVNCMLTLSLRLWTSLLLCLHCTVGYCTTC